jgi:hypothetical protein
MLQQSLPLDDDILKYGYFELYEYDDGNRYKRKFGRHIVILRAKDLNHAEDVVKEKYNAYWLKAGIREVRKQYVLDLCETLKRQLHFCRRALSMDYDK